MKSQPTLPHLSRAVLRTLAKLIPLDQRERWHREWTAELVHWWERLEAGRRRGPSGVLRQLYRTALAAMDAVHVRRLRSAHRADPVGSVTHSSGSPRPGDLIRDLLQDSRFALRTLSRQPGFTLVAVLTMGLGIAVATTIFSLVNGILLRPLPYPEPDRVVAVWPERWFSPSFFDYLEEQATSYEALAAWQWRAHVDIGPDGASRVWGPMVTDGFFDVLDPDPILGRTFADGEDRAGSDGVAVLSYGFWQRRFGGDPAALGESIELRGVPRTVIGVMPPDFDFLHAGTDLVLPVSIDPESVRYDDSSYKVLGRLRQGVSREQAQAELRTLTSRIREENDLPPDWGREADVVTLRDQVVGEIRPTLLLLFGAVGLLLLIATANVANLLLARALTRQREVSLRLALGAEKGRLVRQLLTESTVLGLLGVIPGIAGAALGLRAVLAMLPVETPRLAEVQVDLPVLVFSLALALLTGWLVGLVPALRARGVDLRTGLASGGRGASEGKMRLRSAVVAVEVALAVTLLTGSGVLLKSFWRLNQVDPGFRPDGLLRFEVLAAPGRLRSLAEAEAYFSAISERLDNIPGVEAVSRTTRTPMSPDGNVIRVYREGRPNRSDEDPLMARWLRATPSYFGTAGIPLLQGRLLAESDVAAAEQVALISEEAAERLFLGEDPLGQRIITGFESFPVTVVGVVADLKTLGLDREAPLIIYRAYPQTEAMTERFGVGSGRAFLLRTSVEPESLAASTRVVVRSLDSNALIEGLQSMEAAIADSLTGRRVILVLLSLFAITAVALGSVGIFGVMAYSVQQRKKEISIRIALGSSRGGVLARVLRDGLRIGIPGAVLGLAIALGLSRILERFVYEVSGADPSVLTMAAALGLLMVLLASLLPAWRAGLADPVQALSTD